MRITVRWAGGSVGDRAPSRPQRLALLARATSAERLQWPGSARQWPGEGVVRRPRKRSGATAGSSSSAASEAKGTVRASRAPRVLALLTRIQTIHVFSDERPSKRSMPWMHPEPRLLHDLLGDRAALHVALRDGEHGGVVARDERLERLLVAGAQPGEQLRLGGASVAALELDLGHGLPNLPAGHARSPLRGGDEHEHAPWCSAATSAATASASRPASASRLLELAVRGGVDAADAVGVARDQVAVGVAEAAAALRPAPGA